MPGRCKQGSRGGRLWELQHRLWELQHTTHTPPSLTARSRHRYIIPCLESSSRRPYNSCQSMGIHARVTTHERTAKLCPELAHEGALAPPPCATMSPRNQGTQVPQAPLERTQVQLQHRTASAWAAPPSGASRATQPQATVRALLPPGRGNAAAHQMRHWSPRSRLARRRAARGQPVPCCIQPEAATQHPRCAGCPQPGCTGRVAHTVATAATAAVPSAAPTLSLIHI